MGESCVICACNFAKATTSSLFFRKPIGTERIAAPFLSLVGIISSSNSLLDSTLLNKLKKPSEYPNLTSLLKHSINFEAIFSLVHS
ncbi:hypothetical protein ABBL099_01451 [Acinetobacter baumannii]|nr:hypothetical protein ABBL099_01451 [Acinetobacter baumannii]